MGNSNKRVNTHMVHCYTILQIQRLRKGLQRRLFDAGLYGIRKPVGRALSRLIESNQKCEPLLAGGPGFLVHALHHNAVRTLHPVQDHINYYH